MKRGFSIFLRSLLVPIIERFFIENIEGQNNIPQVSNFILASNHQGYSDHFLITIPFKDWLEKIHFIGKMETFLHPILFGPIYFFAETITVNRKSKKRREVLKKAVQYLNKGKIIIIYPEGGINKEKIIRRGKTGVAELAFKTRSPILPIGISTKKNSFKKIIRIGKPIYFQNVIGEDTSTFRRGQEYKLALRKVTARVMEAISKLCRKKYFYYDSK